MRPDLTSDHPDAAQAERLNDAGSGVRRETIRRRVQGVPSTARPTPCPTSAMRGGGPEDARKRTRRGEGLRARRGTRSGVRARMDANGTGAAGVGIATTRASWRRGAAPWNALELEPEQNRREDARSWDESAAVRRQRRRPVMMRADEGTIRERRSDSRAAGALVDRRRRSSYVDYYVLFFRTTFTSIDSATPRPTHRLATVSSPRHATPQPPRRVIFRERRKRRECPRLPARFPSARGPSRAASGA